MATETPTGLTYTTSAIQTTHDGQIIENLDIWVSEGHAITVTHDNVIIRNCIIHHVTGNGVVVDGAENATIEDSLIVNSSPPQGIEGESEAYDVVNIWVTESPGFEAHYVTLRDGAVGIYAVDSPGSTLSNIEGYNFHGPFPGGQMVQLFRSGNSTLTDFYAFNDADHSHPEDVISVIDSRNVSIARGVIDGNNSVSGVGIMFEGDSDGGGVEHVDAIRMGNGAFSSYSDDVTFDFTRSFDNIDADQGRGESLSNALIWNVSGDSISITNSTYTRPGNPGNIVWEGSEADVVEVREAPQATPQSYITNQFDWTTTGINPGSTPPPPPNDDTAPTVSVSISDRDIRAGESGIVSFAFSEAPVGFALSDATARGGTLTNLVKVDATHYTATFTPSANSQFADARVGVAAASYTDAAGNAGAAGSTADFTVNTRIVDSTPPTVSVSISDTRITTGETGMVSFAFSEAPVGFALSDVTARGGALSNLVKVDATHYTATFTPDSGMRTSTAQVAVSAASYSDQAGNAGLAGSTANFTVSNWSRDNTAPTVSLSISDTNIGNGETGTVSFAFSEAPVGFALSDVTARGGTLSNLVRVDATHYTAAFTPDANTQITDAKVSVVGSSYTDAAGNRGATGGTANFTVNTAMTDNAAPRVSVSISDTNIRAGETGTVAFAFSEVPVGFALSDVTARGGTVSDLARVDSTHYTATFTPNANTQMADARVGLVAASYTDAAGNAGAAGTTGAFSVDTRMVDNTAPGVSVSISDAWITRGETGMVSFAFSEVPVGFALSDVTARGGALSNLVRVDSTHYAATFTPTADTETFNARVSVLAASYTDTAGNAGAAGSTDYFAVDTDWGWRSRGATYDSDDRTAEMPHDWSSNSWHWDLLL